MTTRGAAYHQSGIHDSSVSCERSAELSVAALGIRPEIAMKQFFSFGVGHRSLLVVSALAALLIAGCSTSDSSTDQNAGGSSNGDSGSSALLDCTAVGNVGDPRCSRDCDNAGKVGKGVSFGCISDIGSSRGAFVDFANNRAVASVNTPRTVSTGADRLGLVFSVDLKTGDRSLITGSYNDPATGLMSKGSGPELLDISAPILAPDGTIVVAEAGDPRLVAIEPATGARSSLLAASSIGCSALTMISDEAIQFGAGTYGPDGALYAPLNNSFGNGVVKFTGKPLVCSVVALQSSKDASANKGSGADFAPSGISKLRFQDGQLWALDEFSADGILRIDPSTGARRRLSSYVYKIGSGDARVGTVDLSLAPGAAVTLSEFYDLSGTSLVLGTRVGLTPADAPSGIRSPIPVSSGPALPVGINASTTDLVGMWAVPNSSLLLLESDNAVFMWLDPASGRSATLSL